MTTASRSRRQRALLVPVVLVMGLSATAVWAGKLYTWVDGNGVAHYADSAGDVPANADVLTLHVPPPQPAAFAEMKQVPNGDGTDIYAVNQTQGPVQVMLMFGKAHNVTAQPALPVRQVVPPMGQVLMAHIGAPDMASQPSYEVVLYSHPGDPAARPDNRVYGLPVDQNSRWSLGQSFHGDFSHNDEQNQFAVDFVVPEGTPVLAARAGVVMQVVSGYDRSGQDRKYAERANVIRILHDDGTMGLYAHLQENGVYVQPGERVSVGQQIGASGNTGYSTGPHLHFAVQVNRGMRLVSVPFRMIGPDGFLGLQ